MNFRYVRYATPDGGYIYRPVLPVDLAGPDGEVDFYALLDTGSDDTLIPRFVANELGLTIDDTNVTQVTGIAGGLVPIASAEVELRISDGTESVTWHSRVGIIGDDNDDADYVILGHTACLEFFIATFDGDRRALELYPASTFPGLTGGSTNGSPAGH